MPSVCQKVLLNCLRSHFCSEWNERPSPQLAEFKTALHDEECDKHENDENEKDGDEDDENENDGDEDNEDDEKDLEDD